MKAANCGSKTIDTMRPAKVWSIFAGWVVVLSIASLLTSCGPSTPPPAAGEVMVSPRDGMKLHYVPAGPFTMGSEEYDNEKPVRTVTLDGFWIDETEVTNQMYAVCVKDGKCPLPSLPPDSPYNDAQYADHPVVNVMWDHAKAYCEWAGRRLPTEAQWEKAARGPDGNIYPWGNDEPTKDLSNYENHDTGTSKVGQYPDGKSFYGAYDMAGGVYEWVNDWYEEAYYASAPATNPTGPASGHWRVLRSGSWGSAKYFIRSSTRSFLNPTFVVPDIGFRCALQ